MRPILIKVYTFLLILSYCLAYSQNSANRFFYELAYKKNKDSAKKTKIISILDVTDKKSIYRDFLTVSQDSLITAMSEKFKKSGENVDMQKLIKTPNFTHKVVKDYPIKNIVYSDKIMKDNFTYEEVPNFQWKILSETKLLNNYKVQKASLSYGGKNWVAWFSKDIPISDGPYKFYGLPGLIISIEDVNGTISWTLAGNKNIKNYSEKAIMDGNSTKSIAVSKEKFIQTDRDYRKDPMGKIRATIPTEKLSQKLPDGKTVDQTLKEQEAQMKQFLIDTSINIED